MAKSGVDSLLDALRATGANVDEKLNGKPTNQAGSSSQSSNSSSTKTSSQKSSSGQSQSSGRGSLGDIPKAILDLPVVDRMKHMKTKGKIITAIVIVLLLAAAYW